MGMWEALLEPFQQQHEILRYMYSLYARICTSDAIGSALHPEFDSDPECQQSQPYSWPLLEVPSIWSSAPSTALCQPHFILSIRCSAAWTSGLISLERPEVLTPYSRRIHRPQAHHQVICILPSGVAWRDYSRKLPITLGQNTDYRSSKVPPLCLVQQQTREGNTFAIHNCSFPRTFLCPHTSPFPPPSCCPSSSCSCSLFARSQALHSTCSPVASLVLEV